jgi:hypothetical protein
MKTFIYTLIAAVVIIGGWLAIKASSKPADSNTIIISENGDIAGEYTLADIIAIDESYTCEFIKSDSDSEVKGNIYIAPGAKVRGDFEIDSEATEEPFESHFIMRGGYIYTWTSLLNVGFIAPVTEASTSPQGGGVSFEEKLAYKCLRVTLEHNMFEIPADITFRNI